jgi:hypothetical protein
MSFCLPLLITAAWSWWSLGKEFGAGQGVVGANADSPYWQQAFGALERSVLTTGGPNSFQFRFSDQTLAVGTAGQEVTESFKEGLVDTCGLGNPHGEQQGEIGLYGIFSDCCSRQVQVIDHLHMFCREPWPLPAAKFFPEFLGFVRNKETAVSVIHFHHGSDIVDVQKGENVLLNVVILTGETRRWRGELSCFLLIVHHGGQSMISVPQRTQGYKDRRRRYPSRFAFSSLLYGLDEA